MRLEGLSITRSSGTESILMIPQDGRKLIVKWIIKPDLTVGQNINANAFTITRTATIDGFGVSSGNRYVFTLGFKENIITFTHLETISNDSRTYSQLRDNNIYSGSLPQDTYGFNVMFINKTNKNDNNNKTFNNDPSLMGDKYSWSDRNGDKGDITAQTFSNGNAQYTADAGRSGNGSTSVGWSNNSNNLVYARLNSLNPSNDIENITRVVLNIGNGNNNAVSNSCTTTIAIQGNSYTSSSALKQNGDYTFFVDTNRSNSIRSGKSNLSVIMDAKPYTNNTYYDYNSVTIYYLGGSVSYTN